MNANGMARGYMAKGMKAEKFLLHVLTCVERELQEGDVQTEIIAYTIREVVYYQVHYRGENYGSTLPMDEVKTLQKQSNYALDQKIWADLVDAGLIIPNSSHYLETVYRKYLGRDTRD
jgi:hypothetical protein